MDILIAIREDFFVEATQNAGLEISYLKSTRGEKTPDYLVSLKERDIVVEIGGKGKGLEQFKGITVEKKLILSHSLNTEGLHKPLFLAGFMY